jgi:hypothetical protein
MGINLNRQQRLLLYDYGCYLLRSFRHCVSGRLGIGRIYLGQRPIYHKNQATLWSGFFRVI